MGYNSRDCYRGQFGGKKARPIFFYIFTNGFNKMKYLIIKISHNSFKSIVSYIVVTFLLKLNPGRQEGLMEGIPKTVLRGHERLISSISLLNDFIFSAYL